jgi:hypothetical protein
MEVPRTSAYCVTALIFPCGMRAPSHRPHCSCRRFQLLVVGGGIGAVVFRLERDRQVIKNLH